MIQAIDHVVIVVNDLAAATADYAALGFTVTPGGTHADGQTHNALVALADGAYLELIAFLQPEKPSVHYWWPRLAEGEGIEDFCLLSDGLAGDATRWHAAGLVVQGPVAGGRQRPDGQQLAWQTVRFEQFPGAATLPFVIQDVTPRGLRVPSGTATVHHLTSERMPVTRLMGVRVVTENLQQVLHDSIQLLGTGPIGQTAHTAQFVVGQQWIEWRMPGPNDAEMTQLLQHGAGPYGIVLGDDLGATTRVPLLLDPGRTHGAVIWVA